MTGGLLSQAFVYLAAAVVVVPLAKRLMLGSILGYLAAGVVIGPFVLGLVGTEGREVMHFAEFGVVMMLFLVGLELRPTLLWRLRRPILGLGGAQVVGTAALLGGAATAFGMPWQQAVAVGLILAMSSTAIVVQTLAEKGWLKTSGGQASFSVLLFQDIAVIPIIATFPLLAGEAAAVAGDGAHGPGVGSSWLQAALLVGAVALVVVGGRFLVRPAFRLLAVIRVREVFTAAALLLVIGITLLMQAVGLSPALGTFLAGVALAESEYRHELEADIEPFKGLLLGLFFISVGAEIDFAQIAERPLWVAGVLAGVTGVKAGVLLVLARVFGLERHARWLVAIGLAQVGEFAFVLLSLATSMNVLPAELASALVGAVALSMLATPLGFLLLERVVMARPQAGAERPQEVAAEEDVQVVIAGFGRFGQVVGRLLRSSGIPTTVLDLDPSMIDLTTRLGMKVHYGDASRLDLLHAAGCERARLFVLAVDDPAKSMEIAQTVKKHFPHLPILARARNRTHYYDLENLGVSGIFRETLASALELGEASLRALGFRAHTAHRLALKWRAHDERALRELAALRKGDETTYLAAARRSLQDAEAAMRREVSGRDDLHDEAWQNDSLRAEHGTREGETGT